MPKRQSSGHHPAVHGPLVARKVRKVGDRCSHKNLRPKQRDLQGEARESDSAVGYASWADIARRGLPACEDGAWT